MVPIDLDRAVNAAHDLLRSRAGRRLDTLDEDGRHAQAAEVTRTEAYYHDVLAGIERRRTDAAPDRQAALGSRAEATRQERSRRLAEIKEKHQARFDLTPYRLHLLLVPAVVLPVNVMRGSRRYPQRLIWIWPARRFRALPCPTCGSDRPLVAGKSVLGCEACLARPAPEPTSTTDEAHRRGRTGETHRQRNPPQRSPPLRNPPQRNPPLRSPPQRNPPQRNPRPGLPGRSPRPRGRQRSGSRLRARSDPPAIGS